MSRPIIGKLVPGPDLSGRLEAIRQDVVQGILPIMPPPASSRDAELGHVLIDAVWNELVRESWDNEIFERLRPVATGTLHVTNQRLVFHSRAKTASLEFKDIVDVAKVNGHLYIEMIGPNDPYILLDPPEALELIELILSKAIERSRLNKKARLVGSNRRKRL